jgi:F-type H+-transporting ATPase subunit c
MEHLGAFIGAGLAIGVAAGGGAVGIGLLMSKVIEGAARQPESLTNLRPLMFIGIAFIEALALYGLVVSLILIGK